MTKKNAVLYLQKNAIYYAIDGAAQIYNYSFQTSTVKDFEILNQEMFEYEITHFFQTNKLPPANIAIIFASDTLFIQKFENITKEAAQTNQIIQEYLERIPFEHVAKLFIPENKNLIVYTTNEEFINCIKHALEKLGSTIEIASISVVINSTFNVTGLDTTNANILLHHFSTFRQYNLASPGTVEQPKTAPVGTTTQTMVTKKSNTKSSSKRAYILVAVFIVLLGVLGYMLWNTFRPVEKPKPVPAATNVNPTAVPTVQKSTNSSSSAEPNTP